MVVRMDDQKLSDELNLAINIPNDIREKASDINEGYDGKNGTWELIVKYNGNLVEAAAKIGATVETLLGGYAIAVVRESQIEEFSMLKEVEFVEKPNRLYFSDKSHAEKNVYVASTKRTNEHLFFQENNLRISQSVAGQLSEYSIDALTGEGVIVAIIDSGIDVLHKDFIDEYGKSRILKLWDQTSDSRDYNPPTGYIYGAEYNNEDIKRMLLNPQNKMSFDVSGHGTFVAGLASGNGKESNEIYRGVAYKSSLIIVKLGTSQGFLRTTRLMEAIDYCLKQAVLFNMPIAINLSLGNNQGSHDGTDLTSTFLDAAAGVWKNVIVCASGNEAGAANHAHGIVNNNSQSIIEWGISEYEVSISLSLWKNYVDSFRIDLIAPSGVRIDNVSIGINSYTVNETKVYVNYGEPKPFSRFQQIYFEFIPQNSYINAGLWKIVITPIRIVDGQYDAWLPESMTINRNTGFLLPDENTTLTVPSASTKVITVGAYNSKTNAYADFSGRGYTRTDNIVKPDIVAPGVDIMSAAVGGGYTIRSGTSMAAPIVTGSAALLMEWGIIRGNDPFLYGEKIKAWLIKAAKPLSGNETYPNKKTGWGALSLRNILPDTL